MSKVIKYTLIHILAFFILDGLLIHPLNAQDIKTLENGLRVIVKEDHRNPIVVFSALVDIGSAFEGEYLGSGISHLIEHMLFKGTKKYPPGAIEDTLHKHGGNISGFTSYDYTGFRITILKEHKDIALDVLKEMLTSPTFDVKELKKEKEVIEREMDLTRDDPARRVSRLTFSRSYIRHPYRVPIIGYKENFKRLERDDLIKFFRSSYSPDRIVVAIVGDIDKEDIFEKVQDSLGDIPRKNHEAISLPIEPEQISDRYIEEKLDINGAYLNIGFHSTSLMNEDLYPLDVLSFILGQGESSILNEEIRINKELVLSISSYNYTPKEKGIFVISSVLKKEEDVKEVIDEIIKQVDLVKEKGVTEEQLERAKNNFLASYIYQKETIESQANDMVIGELLTGNSRFFEFYIERIKSVSLDGIQRVARKYLNRKRMSVALVSKSGSALDILREPILSKDEKEIEKIVLENNLPVLIHENPAIPIVSISMLFKGGLRFEGAYNNGISKITSLMLMDGIDTMTRQELTLFYESKGMVVDTYSENNSLGISVSCLKEHTEEALKLIASFSLSPTFPEKELFREKNELNSIIDMQDNNIFNHGHRLLKEKLFKVHPYRFQTTGTHESIKDIKRDDVLSFHKNILSIDNLVLGISGDCNIDEVKVLAEKYLAKVPLKKLDLVLPARELPINNRREIFIKTDKDQSLIFLGFHGTSIYDEKRYAIELMVDILSGESGILFKSIREKKGLSYAQGAFQVLGIDPGYIAVYTLTSKENIDKVKEIIFKEITSFIKKGVSTEELEKSKNYLKAMRQIAIQTNSYFIFTSSLDELYGLGYNNYKDYDKNIDGVTKEDIKRVAESFLTLDKYAVVILEGR